ncbi:MAG: ModD protein [Coriobacteriales bacterium]|jgi:molybdenum transport protein|nr:ModD protein [Coriobacteriales bacterium]
MFYIPDSELERLIAEDLPYLDLTTHLLGIDERLGQITYLSREDCLLCGSEEVRRIFAKLGVTVDASLPSGTRLKAGEVFFEASGTAGALHAGWKVCLNLFDHYSAVATRTRAMVDAAQAVAPGLPILTTRKSLPGSRALMTKAIVCGGAVPHRLGLSETVLVFDNHSAFVGGFAGLLERLPEMLAQSCEKKVFVEADAAQAEQLAKSGIDGIQFDKVAPDELRQLIPRLRVANPQLTLIAAGGINLQNVADYAATGVDGLATTALFTAKPLDMTARITPR